MAGGCRLRRDRRSARRVTADRVGPDDEVARVGSADEHQRPAGAVHRAGRTAGRGRAAGLRLRVEPQARESAARPAAVADADEPRGRAHRARGALCRLRLSRPDDHRFHHAGRHRAGAALGQLVRRHVRRAARRRHRRADPGDEARRPGRWARRGHGAAGRRVSGRRDRHVWAAPSPWPQSGTETLALLRTARGSVAATIVNGTMPRLELVRPIVLAFGKPTRCAAGRLGLDVHTARRQLRARRWHNDDRRSDDDVARLRSGGPRHACTLPAARCRRGRTSCSRRS